MPMRKVIYPQKLLIKILKSIFSDVRQVIVGSIFLLIVGGTAGLLALSQKSLSFAAQIANIQMPLWVTIVLVLLLGVYIGLGKHRRSRTYNPRLNDIEVKILLFLSNQSERLTAEDVARSLNMNIQVATFHLEELAKSKMVLRLSYVGSPPDWLLFQEGRRYLIEKKLLS